MSKMLKVMIGVPAFQEEENIGELLSTLTRNTSPEIRAGYDIKSILKAS